jgi:hypothetical protein
MLDQVEGLRDILAAHSNHIQAKEVPLAKMDRGHTVGLMPQRHAVAR